MGAEDGNDALYIVVYDTTVVKKFYAGKKEA
jgi:hypothetical protein